MSTIAAISTPAGVGGIAVVRISGPQALQMVLRHIDRSVLKPRMATYCRFSIENRMLDEVVVTYFVAPHSYTGEELVEVSCHGSRYVQQQLLQSLLDDGCRLAEPGEFTRRAFLAGRLDLSQAEAVADLIDSTNSANHTLAINQLRGGYAQKLKQLRQRFVELISLLELELDFSEEEVEFANRKQLMDLIAELTSECNHLAETFSLGNAIKQGVPVAIAGRPNVGKSTLLNALLGDERAIVSNIPGTTRDTVEDTLTLDGIGFRIIDTAGLRHSDDTIENAGIERSYQAIEKAHIVLYLVDSALTEEEIASELESLHQQCSTQGKKLIVISTKADLHPNEKKGNLSIAAATGEGIELLKQRLVEIVRQQSSQNERPLVSNLRHYEALVHIVEACKEAQKGMMQQLPADLIVIDLRDALYHLGTITGEVASDEILGTIFSRFCIGK